MQIMKNKNIKKKVVVPTTKQSPPLLKLDKQTQEASVQSTAKPMPITTYVEVTTYAEAALNLENKINQILKCITACKVKVKTFIAITIKTFERHSHFKQFKNTSTIETLLSI